MILFPKKLEKLLQDYLKKTFYPGTRRQPLAQKPFDHKDLKFFAKGAAKLSKQFTSERTRLKGDYLKDPPSRAGYLLYFLPINFAKASFVYRRLPETFWKRSKFRILDMGAGPATASLAFLNEVRGRNPDAKLEFHLSDQNKSILRDGQKLLSAWKKELKYPGAFVDRPLAKNLQEIKLSGKFDLILLHHVLNELVHWKAHRRRLWLHRVLKSHLKNDGILALLEPALKRPGRELMALRDQLLEKEDFTVLGPCLHEKICPMLAGTKKDWCHFYIDWKEPGFLKQLDRLLKNDNHFLKLSYLLLGRTEAFSKFFPHRDTLFRLVSNRMATRGKTEAVLCGSPGRIRVTRLNRHRSDANADLDRVRRGDLVKVPGIPRGEYQLAGSVRLGPRDTFQIVQKVFK